MKLLFLDCETTGLDAQKYGLIQVSGVIDEINEHGEVTLLEKFDFKMKPFKGDLIGKEALDVQGLKIEDLERRRDPTECYGELINIFQRHVDRYNKADKFVFVGQNPRFDYDFVSEWFKKNGNKYFYAFVFYHLIDIGTISAMFKTLGKLSLPDYKLATVAKRFGVEINAHDSESDVNATREIFYKYRDVLKESKIPEGW